ncbi:DUF3515 family protein [Luethyella okanaganae]|uniref:DUF3515 family protein n=1 Tax=Luethyella okanaganae TaxID=69372 RepID=A0ABW1VFF1_9MICO
MTSHSLPHASVAITTALLTAGTLAGCASAVPFDAAPNAADPLCAEVIVRLPDSVGDNRIRETNAQATGAWGDPAAVLLRCGVDVPGPTTLRCVNVNGVDWIADESRAPVFRFTSYGRTPAVEVVVDNDKASGSVLVDLSAAVSSIPAEKQCLDVTDVAP